MLLKKLFFAILLITPLLCTAQKTKKLSKSEKLAIRLYEREFGIEHDAFKVSVIPEEYSDESDITLAKKVHIVFGRNNKGKTATQIATRKRILLNDQAAVKDYSEFFYQKSDMIGITIVKPDGSQSKMNLDNAVEVTTDIPKQYQDRYQGDDYYKVAIPDLEEGDIIDFFKVFNNPESSQREFTIPVASYRPVIHQELTIDVDKYWTLYYGSLNGAPEFKIDKKNGYNMKGKQSDKVKRLRFEYENAEGKKWERWAVINDEVPIIKLIAAPIKSPLHQKTTIVKGIKSEDYIIQNMKGVKDVTKLIMKSSHSYIKGLKLKEIEESDAAEMIYRGLRVLLLRSMAQTESTDVTAISRAISRQRLGISDAVFVSVFAKILNKSKIASEIVLARSSSRNEDDFLVGQEVTLGVYIPKVDKYYWPFTNFSRPGETPYYLEGLNVIMIPYAKVFKNEAAQYAKSSVLSSSKIVENRYDITATVDIAADNSLLYKSTTDLTGYFREIYSPLFLFNTNYLSEDISFSEVDKLFGYTFGSFRMSSNEPFARKHAEFEESVKIKNERLKRWLEGEHAELKIMHFQVDEYGMMNEEKTLSVAYEFSSNQFVKKAGPNLIFDIGKVAGDQLQLDRDELEGRRSDIKIECPKSISSEITITLPKGLTARGLEDLNMEVENEIGRFECKAVQEDNIIKMTTVKDYKVNTLSADKWPLMVEFLEAAYEQSQKKVILK